MIRFLSGREFPLSGSSLSSSVPSVCCPLPFGLPSPSKSASIHVKVCRKMRARLVCCISRATIFTGKRWTRLVSRSQASACATGLSFETSVASFSANFLRIHFNDHSSSGPNGLLSSSAYSASELAFPSLSVIRFSSERSKGKFCSEAIVASCVGNGSVLLSTSASCCSIAL